MSENTIPELMEKRVKDHGTRLLFQRRDGWSWKQITWLDFDREVKNIASFLMDLGFGKGDRALLVSANTLEAISTEIAVYHLGGTVVPLSPLTGAAHIKQVARELQVKFIFIEDPGLLDATGAMLEELPGVIRAAFFRDIRTKNEKVLNFRSILKFGLMKRKKLHDELKKVSDETDANTLAAIFLNPEKSGSKSNEITQGDIISALELISSKTNGIGDEDQSFSYISSASPYSKIINYLTLYKGTRAATAESREDFYQDITEVMPTMLFETSEGLEGLYKKSVASLDGLSPENKLKRDLGSRVSYIFTDALPASQIESIYRGLGATFSVVAELTDIITE